MQTPKELLTDAATTVEVAIDLQAIKAEHEAIAEELTVKQFLKEHVAQVFIAVIFCGTLFAVWLLTRK